MILLIQFGPTDMVHRWRSVPSAMCSVAWNADGTIHTITHYEGQNAQVWQGKDITAAYECGCQGTGHEIVLRSADKSEPLSKTGQLPCGAVYMGAGPKPKAK